MLSEYSARHSENLLTDNQLEHGQQRGIEITYGPESKKDNLNFIVESSSKDPSNKAASLLELLAVSQPLMGPGFNADEHIEDWSDDSDEDADQSNSSLSDDDILDQLSLAAPLPLGGLALRRNVATIYMPIRIGCLYG